MNKIAQAVYDLALPLARELRLEPWQAAVWATV